MNPIKTHLLALLLFSALLVSGCTKNLVVKNVNYTQQVESVLQPDANGVVNDIRYGISYSILPFQYQEFNDTTLILIDEVRMIRNSDGFYFITANGFRHVYVVEPGKGEFEVVKEILISEEGLVGPALNWRNPAVQLVSDNNQAMFINEEGIIKEEGQS